MASHPITFDPFIDELVVALTVGARVVLADDHDRTDPEALITLIDREGVTVVTSTPTLLSALVTAGWHPGERVEVWTGGEALPTALAAELVQRCGRVLNQYGPTETTVYASQHEVDASDLDGSHSMPIGRPAGDHRFVVVDDRGEPVPIGVYGELLIAGRCVARGYRNQPELTAAAFVNRPDPFTGELRRWYRTGDVVRWRADGALEYVGRRDAQIKLRGVRIELGDVEAAIAAHPSVQAAAAAVRGEQLVAWVVVSGDTPAAADLRRHCADLLPLSMVPATFVALDELPHNANGKLDRDALPDPETSTRPSGREPSTPTEIALAELWRELFGADAVKVDEEFFDLGGHSLLVISLFAAIEERFGKALPLSQIFETPTIASLAAVLDDVGPVAGSVVLLQEGAAEQPALFLLPGLRGSSVMFHLFVRLFELPGVVYGVEVPVQREPPNLLTMEEIAAPLVADVLDVARGRQIVLAGFSFGGKLAFEMARQLAAKDADCRLVIVDSDAPEPALARRLLRHRAAQSPSSSAFVALPPSSERRCRSKFRSPGASPIAPRGSGRSGTTGRRRTIETTSCCSRRPRRSRAVATRRCGGGATSADRSSCAASAATTRSS